MGNFSRANNYVQRLCNNVSTFQGVMIDIMLILNGMSVITMKTLGVHYILLNAVFFHSWDTDCIAIK